MTYIPSARNSNLGLRAAALQKRLFTKSNKSIIQYLSILLHEVVELQ